MRSERLVFVAEAPRVFLVKREAVGFVFEIEAEDGVVWYVDWEWGG